MGTINNPGKFDCLAKLKPDEPHFVLRANDALAPKCVMDWAARAAEAGTPPEKVEEAVACAVAMKKWQAEYGAKVPD